MSVDEVAKFKALIKKWVESDAKKDERELLNFLAMYRFSIVSALELAAR